jgi:hypothetical protein
MVLLTRPIRSIVNGLPTSGSATAGRKTVYLSYHFSRTALYATPQYANRHTPGPPSYSHVTSF